jgi:hypothetical protein
LRKRFGLSDVSVHPISGYALTKILKRTGKSADGTRHSVQTSEVGKAFNLTIRE